MTGPGEESSRAEHWMREAIRLAEEGVRRGDGGPFGAVVVRGGKVVGRGWNRVVTESDPTAHAEIIAIRGACRALGDFRLAGCELYTTCEPCPMCLAAAYWARLDAVWFAATGSDAAAFGFDDTRIHRELRKPQHLRTLPANQLLRNEALAVFRLWHRREGRVDY